MFGLLRFPFDFPPALPFCFVAGIGVRTPPFLVRPDRWHVFVLSHLFSSILWVAKNLLQICWRTLAPVRIRLRPPIHFQGLGG